MLSCLASLPIELLHVILDHLSLRGLRQFAQTSRGCYAAAKYRILRVVFVDLDRATESTRQLTALLDCHDSWSVVHRLTLGSAYVHSLDGERLLDFPMRLLDLSQRSQGNLGDAEVASLGALTSRLKNLTDIVLETKCSLPDSFFRGVFESCPNCRLHMRSFTTNKLTNTSQHCGPETGMLPLRSLWIHDPNDLLPRSEWMSYHDLAFDNFSSVGPALNEVRFLASASEDEDQDSMISGRRHDNLASQHGLCSLQVLQITGYSQLSRSVFEILSFRTDFTKLRELDIATAPSAHAFRFLADCSFPTLSKLGLALNLDDNAVAVETSSQAAERFLLYSVPPLLTLKLSGRMSRRCLDKVMTYQGTKLDDLWLQPVGLTCRLALDARDLRHIVESCRVLRRCTLTVVRSQSNAQEIALYQLLGSIPKLTDVVLRLDVANPLLVEPEQLDLDELDDNAMDNYDVPTDSSFDAFDTLHFDESFGTWLRPRNGHVRIMLINAAVDQWLALSIFEIISKTRQLVSGSHLSTLNVSSVGGGNFGSNVSVPYIAKVFNEISRSWLLERTQSNTHELGVSILEIPTQTTSTFPVSELHPCIEPIFRKIWPGNGDWRKEWKSILPTAIWST